MPEKAGQRLAEMQSINSMYVTFRNNSSGGTFQQSSWRPQGSSGTRHGDDDDEPAAQHPTCGAKTSATSAVIRISMESPNTQIFLGGIKIYTSEDHLAVVADAVLFAYWKGCHGLYIR
jgi:hypothetical protein